MSNFDAKVNRDRCVAGAAGIRYCSRIRDARDRIAALEKELEEAQEYTASFKRVCKERDQLKGELDIMVDSALKSASALQDSFITRKEAEAECFTLQERVASLEEALQGVMDEYVPDSTFGDDGCPITLQAVEALKKD